MEGTGVQYDETKIPFEIYFGEPSIEISKGLYLNRETPNVLEYYRHQKTVYMHIKSIYGKGTPQYKALEKEITHWQQRIDTFKIRRENSKFNQCHMA